MDFESCHSESLDLLEGRIQRLERICFGDKAESSDGNQVNLQEQLCSIEKRVQVMEANIPELKPVLENLKRVSPILSFKRQSLKETIESMNQILSRREELEQHFKTMKSIQQLSHVVEVDSFADIDSLKERLDKVELDILLIKPRVAMQMKEIDDLIDIYEKGMLFLSKVIQSREIKAMDQGETQN